MFCDNVESTDGECGLAFDWKPSSNEIALRGAKHLIYKTQHTWNVKCEKETEMIDLCERWKNMNDNERREQLRTTIGLDEPYEGVCHRMAEFDVSEMDLDYYYDAESAFDTFYVIDGYLLMDDKDSSINMYYYMQELEIIQGSAAAEEKLNKILPECIVQIILNHMSVPADEDMYD
eukprot:UN13169